MHDRDEDLTDVVTLVDALCALFEFGSLALFVVSLPILAGLVFGAIR